MKILIPLIFSLILTSVNADDMQHYNKLTQEMLRKGKHKEALERLVWFHKHALEHDPGMYGVRLSFALEAWNDLGKVYKPAKIALIETRDISMKSIIAGKGNRDLFVDVMALNETLGEENKTVSLFEKVDKERPKKAVIYWDVASSSIIKAKKYELANKYIGDLEKAYSKVKSSYDKEIILYKEPDMKSWIQDIFIEECLKLIEVSIASGKLDTAKLIQTKSLSVIEDTRLLKAIPTK